VNRVVITGVGPVSSIGIGVAAFGDALRAGRSGISPITSFDTTGFPHVCAGEVRDFQPDRILERLDISQWGRSALFAAAAARLAVKDARLDMAALSPDRTGTVIGTTCGESQVLETLTRQMLEAGFASQSSDLLRQSAGSRLAAAVSEEIGAAGESLTISTACAASNYALGYAYDLLAHGDLDVMIAGGADSVCQWVHAGFFRLGTLAKDACSPFDRGRSGMVTAEGGSALVLETMDHARARGARVYAEVLGYGLNCDAHHMVAPNAGGIAACMRVAHANAGVRPSDIDYICAHGTGTPANDSAEILAIREVFGDLVPPVSSIKSMLGHTMGAASGFEAISCVMAVRHDRIPPTMNFETPDPECPVDCVPNVMRDARVGVALSNSFAFGGNNAVLVLGEAR